MSAAAARSGRRFRSDAAPPRTQACAPAAASRAPQQAAGLKPPAASADLSPPFDLAPWTRAAPAPPPLTDLTVARTPDAEDDR